MIKSIKDVNISDVVNGNTIIGKYAAAGDWITLVYFDETGLRKMSFPRHAEIMVDNCMADTKPTLKWGGEIVTGKPFHCELLWHRTRDVLPPTDGRCLICTKQAKHPIIAEITICHTLTGDAYVVWSRLIKGTHERIAEDDVYWWAWIPLPVDEN